MYHVCETVLTIFLHPCSWHVNYLIMLHFHMRSKGPCIHAHVYDLMYLGSSQNENSQMRSRTICCLTLTHVQKLNMFLASYHELILMHMYRMFLFPKWQVTLRGLKAWLQYFYHVFLTWFMAAVGHEDANKIRVYFMSAPPIYLLLNYTQATPPISA